MVELKSMINLIIKKFINNVPEGKRRTRAGTVGGVVGIAVNVLLAATKAVIGFAFGSISTVADAVNNLTDAASSIITALGFKLAGKKPDADHPYGHGRIEYISGLVMAFIVLILGLSLLRDSVAQVIKPADMRFSWVSVIVLLLAIFAKLWLSLFFKKMNAITGSATFLAASVDSRNDVVTTLSVLVSLFIFKIWGVNVDGVAGIAVSVFILVSGVGLIKETLDPLLGRPPEKEFVESIYKKVLAYDGVIGVHDLVVHDYGPGRVFVSLHAEVPCDANILVSHDLIDNIERDFKQELGIETVIHIDPIITDDPYVNELRAQAVKILKNIDARLTLHDFRAVTGPTHTNIIFDAVIPADLKESEVKCAFENELERLLPDVRAVITFDSPYV